MFHANRFRSQQTVRRPLAVAGCGYWSGRENRVEIHPAQAGAGVVFVRADLDVPVRIPAWIGSRIDASSRTNLAASAAGGQVHMVEHVLSALAGLGVDCCVVRVHGEELPGLDGSSRAFVDAIDSVGVVELGAPVEPVVVRETVRVGDASAWIEASPPVFGGLSIDYELDYGPGPIGRQSLSLQVTPESYREGLAAARTFISAADAERLRGDGLGLAVAHSELLVFGPDGPIDNSLRWPDECVRHKVLDVVGDLSLAGRPIHAHVRACRSGHRLNAALVERMLGCARLRASA